MERGKSTRLILVLFFILYLILWLIPISFIQLIYFFLTPSKITYLQKPGLMIYIANSFIFSISATPCHSVGVNYKIINFIRH